MSTTTMSTTTKHPLAGKKIIVAGAGIAGMTFASALYQMWPAEHPRPEVVIYERSSREQDRGRNGYTMNIRGESGLSALETIGLLPTALELSTTTSKGQTKQYPTFWTKDWTPMLRFNQKPIPPTQTPAIIRLVRYMLRDMLLDHLPSSTKVHFDRGCGSVRHLSNGKVEVTLQDGSTDTCDLLVAADGASSSIRTALLPDQKLTYLGIVSFIGTSRFDEGQKPERFRNEWGMAISGLGVPFLTFPVDDNTGVWALSYRSPQPRERVRGDEAMTRKDEILNEVKTKGAMFGTPLADFVDATDERTLAVFSAMHKYPVRHAEDLPSQAATPKVVFLGDANHPMSPFSGSGANMALMDGVSLARELAGLKATEEEGVKVAIEAFDRESVPRSTKAIDRSWWTIRILHSEGWTFVLLRTLLNFVGLIAWLKGS